MKLEIDSKVSDLLNQLRQLHDKAEVLTEHQAELTAQLKAAREIAHALHQKILEEQSDMGGEG